MVVLKKKPFTLQLDNNISGETRLVDPVEPLIIVAGLIYNTPSVS
jgi:hypothetical protein